MTRSARRAAPGPRLLLLAALLLGGVITLLSPGRPAGPHAMEDVSPGRCVASAKASGAAARGGAHHTPATPPQVRGAAQEPAPEPEQAARAAASATGTGRPGSGCPAVPTGTAPGLPLRQAVLRI
ncbi:hypothetical protein [Streptomyces sp. A0592]|uniref:hypothetical protein n=1 Tax=Streptomyces sp. A0592 TaxID=2563099 RepID=UPI00109EB385|nr:hypothetical protein [Streptomyces sp. A0592]THA77870.1 hypothetical protein E6U81_33920 [Streptomyces sp. A0592]